MTVIKSEGIPGRRFEAVPKGSCQTCAFHPTSPRGGTLTQDQRVTGCVVGGEDCTPKNLNFKEVGYDPAHR